MRSYLLFDCVNTLTKMRISDAIEIAFTEIRGVFSEGIERLATFHSVSNQRISGVYL